MKTFILAALLAAAAAPALAQSTTPPPAAGTSTTTTSTTTTPAAGQSSARAAVGAACAADFKTNCPNNTPGTPEMQQCVRDNFDKMSDGCKSAIMTMMAQGGGGER